MSWEVEGCVAEQCSWQPAEYKLILNKNVWNAAVELTRQIKTEWQMLLIGSVADRVARVVDYYIQEQEVTGSSVTPQEVITMDMVRRMKLIGTLHSHANMGVFFSNTDIKTCCSGLDWHVVVNNALDTVAKVKAQTPCGMYAVKDCVLELPRTARVVVRGLSKIRKFTYTPPENAQMLLPFKSRSAALRCKYEDVCGPCGAQMYECGGFEAMEGGLLHDSK